MERTAQKTRRPALPMALGLQGLVAVSVFLVALTMGVPAAEPTPAVEGALVTMDVPKAQQALSSKLAATQQRLASQVLARPLVQPHAIKATSNAGFEVGAVKAWPVDDPLAATGTTRLVLSARGPVYGVPRLMAGLMGSHLAVPVTLRLSSSGAEVELQAVVDYPRPAIRSHDWIAQRLTTALPGADHALDVMVDAQTLISHSTFEDRLAELQDLGNQRRQTVAQLLPRHLIQMHRSGGRLVWTPDRGVHFD